MLLLVTFTLIPQIQLRPLWSTAFVAVLLAYRAWLDFTISPMPPRQVLWLGQLIVAVAIWINFQTFLGAEAAGTFLTLLIGMKIFELRERRDFFITCILCLLVLMSFLLADQGLLITGFLVTNVVFVITLMYAIEAEDWSWTSWRPFLRPGMTLTLKALPLLILTFLLFPRFSTGFGTGSTTVGRTGMSDTLQPGSVARLISSDEVVFRATFLKGDLPSTNSLYWRGAVLDEVSGMNWSRKAIQDEGETPIAMPVNPEVEIHLEPGSERFLFTLESSGLVAFPSDVQNRRIRQREGNIFELREPLQVRDRYNLESTPLHRESPPSAELTTLEDEPSKKMSAYLAQMNGLSVAEIVRRVMQTFRDGGFVYTLEPPPTTTVDQFFFGSKEGFCEHYAGTLATILRRMQIPARVVVGFQGGTPTFLGNYITVRGHDAHAWVEYFDYQGSRWRRVDPTEQVAPARLTLGGEDFMRAEDSLLSADWLPRTWLNLRLRTRALFDQVDASWTGFLLGFDLAWQRNLLARLGMDGVLFRALPVFLVLGLALILALLYFFEAQRRESVPAEEKLYRGLQQALRRRGIEREAFEGPLALMRKTEAHSAELAEAVDPILTPLVLARFGREPLTAASIRQIKRHIRELRRISG